MICRHLESNIRHYVTYLHHKVNFFRLNSYWTDKRCFRRLQIIEVTRENTKLKNSDLTNSPECADFEPFADQIGKFYPTASKSAFGRLSGPGRSRRNDVYLFDINDNNAISGFLLRYFSAQCTDHRKKNLQPPQQDMTHDTG